MSHIRCPMCGKDSACSTFHPENLDTDIYIRQATGLGRGAGFSYGPDESILGDDQYTPKVMNRCMELLTAGITTGCITKPEIDKQLNIGVPMEGTDRIVPYDEVVQAKNTQIRSLQSQVKKLEEQVSRAKSGVSTYVYDELMKRCEKMESDNEARKRIDGVLRFLHTELDSKISFEGDDWILEIHEFDPIIIPHLYRRLYKLSRGERETLRSRMKTEDIEVEVAFEIFRGEPTIRGVSDILTKNPGKLYYVVHDIPVPQGPILRLLS